MKKFILPEKWAIKIPQKGVNEVTQWFNENNQTGALDYNTYDGFLHYPKFAALDNPYNQCHQDNILNEDYTEITLEQFQKYVLKTPTGDISFLTKLLKKLDIV